MSSPWGKVPQVHPVDLTDIMSEEVAKDLHEKELAYFKGACANLKAQVNYDQHLLPTKDKTDEDMIKELLYADEAQMKTDCEIALMLQQQYDKEYDENLQRTEDKYNGSSKVSVSFTNYRRAPLNPDFESDTDEEEEPENPNKDWDRFDGVQRDYKAMPPCGYRLKDGNMVTKHDTALNGRRNACRMMSFPPECETGDGAGFDLQLSNKVFNSLRKHSKNEVVRRHHRNDRKEEHATAEFGMDEHTRLLIYKMINKQLLEKVNGVISIGKEAVVLHADCNVEYPDVEEPLPPECVLKVFKTTLSEYKQRDKYIKDDHRFKGRMSKQNTKKVVHLWAEKEMRNLIRLQKADVPVPRVIALKQHVLVMSFIGKDHQAAPKLKDARLNNAELIIAYDQVIDAMKNLYHKANLIHADLSEYNILWYQEKCYIIDVSQAVEPSHENAFHFLFRDCTNISNFFLKKCVPEVDTPEIMFKAIVGHDFGDRVGLSELQENFKMKPHLVDRPGVDLDYRFDNAWERSELKKKQHASVVEPPVA